MYVVLLRIKTMEPSLLYQPYIHIFVMPTAVGTWQPFPTTPSCLNSTALRPIGFFALAPGPRSLNPLSPRSRVVLCPLSSVPATFAAAAANEYRMILHYIRQFLTCSKVRHRGSFRRHVAPKLVCQGTHSRSTYVHIHMYVTLYIRTYIHTTYI